MRAILYKIAHFDGCLAQTGPLHEKDPVPNANSFFTPGLLVCAVKTMICYGFLAKHQIDFIPGILASAQPPAIDPYAVTSYCQFEESQSANSLSSGAACVTKTVVRGCGAGAGLMRASNHGRKWDLITVSNRREQTKANWLCQRFSTASSKLRAAAAHDVQLQ